MPDQTIPQPVRKTVHNPLANYFRQPKLYLKLPSKGKFYPEGSLDVSETEEYPVFAMTAKDELMFKTPDALMNGAATVEVIKSCIPAIKNPWHMPSIDMDPVLIAIRIATYGERMEVKSSCPSCDHRNEYDINLLSFLDKVSEFAYNDTLAVSELTLNIRPYTYKELTKIAIKTFEQQKLIAIVNDDELSDEEKVEKFGESFVNLTGMTVDVVVNCIESIETPDGTVTDKAMLKEFMENTSSEIFNLVNDQIKEMKDIMALKAEGIECEECQHKFTLEIAMDQTNFFVVGS
jgi:hypothetical protein